MPTFSHEYPVGTFILWHCNPQERQFSEIWEIIEPHDSQGASMRCARSGEYTEQGYIVSMGNRRGWVLPMDHQVVVPCACPKHEGRSVFHSVREG